MEEEIYEIEDDFDDYDEYEDYCIEDGVSDTMLPKIDTTSADWWDGIARWDGIAWKLMQKSLSYLEGPISFAIATRRTEKDPWGNPDGRIDIHHRHLQPCYGELRKYKKTHGDEATRGESKPADLHFPFPSGLPIALAVRTKELGPQTHDFAKFIFSKESPWASAFKEVYFFDDGYILNDLQVDPTILVNAINMVRSGTAPTFFLAKENGLTDHEAISLAMSLSVTDHWVVSGASQGYYVPSMGRLDFGRLYLKQPRNDLSNGRLFSDREDYNREMLECPFEIVEATQYYSEVTSMCYKYGEPKPPIEETFAKWKDFCAQKTEEHLGYLEKKEAA